jgi:hypothetical protein
MAEAASAPVEQIVFTLRVMKPKNRLEVLAAALDGDASSLVMIAAARAVYSRIDAGNSLCAGCDRRLRGNVTITTTIRMTDEGRFMAAFGLCPRCVSDSKSAMRSAVRALRLDVDAAAREVNVPHAEGGTA